MLERLSRVNRHKYSVIYVSQSEVSNHKWVKLFVARKKVQVFLKKLKILPADTNRGKKTLLIENSVENKINVAYVTVKKSCFLMHRMFDRMDE